MAHKHHENQDGVPHVHKDDLFLLVAEPLSKRPKYFIGHSRLHGIQTVHTACVAKRMSMVEAKAWHDFLEKAGANFFLSTHHEPPARKPRIRILS